MTPRQPRLGPDVSADVPDEGYVADDRPVLEGDLVTPTPGAPTDEGETG